MYRSLTRGFARGASIALFVRMLGSCLDSVVPNTIVASLSLYHSEFEHSPGAQADNTRLTSKKTSNVHFIARVLLSAVSAAQRLAHQPQRASAAERRWLKAHVGRTSCWLSRTINAHQSPSHLRLSHKRGVNTLCQSLKIWIKGTDHWSQVKGFSHLSSRLGLFRIMQYDAGL